MLTVDSTVAGVASNSYVSLLEADSYFEGVYGKTLWNDSLTPEIKSQLIVSATGALDAYFTWTGQRYTIDQALDWPRINVYDRNGFAYPYSSIPNTIKVATFELAYHLLSNGGLTYEQNKIDEVKVGSIDVKFSNYVIQTGIPEYIAAIIAHVGETLYRNKGQMHVAQLERT